MLLYLVQHAESMSKEEDPSRGLSEKGFRDIKKIAAFIKGLDIDVREIVHSGKKRALQTAEVLVESVRADMGVNESDGLSPKDDPGIWVEKIAGLEGDEMLVGHLPHLARLAAMLLSGDRNMVEFENAGIVCLKRSEDRSWAVDWVIKPRLIG
jgi:phosphohistidine phosphatase